MTRASIHRFDLQTDPQPRPSQAAPLLLELAAEHYFATLKTTPTALQSIKWRGTVGAELVEHFRLGLSDGTLEAQLTSRQGLTRDALVRVGLLRKSGAERFAGTLVVPVFDAAGRVVQLRGGEVHVRTGRCTAERSIPPGVDAVFHRAGFFSSEELIIAPSAIDALRFWFAGHVNVSAAGELHGLLALMKEAKTKRALLAFDAFDDGDRAAIAFAQRLADAGIDAYRVALDRRFMPTSRQWTRLVREATPMLGAPPRPEPPPIDLHWSRHQPTRSAQKEDLR